MASETERADRGSLEVQSYLGVSAAFALEVQNNANKIARSIASTPLLLNQWSLPLRAAPEAIAVLATCLVAASTSCARVTQINPNVNINPGTDGKNAARVETRVLPYSSVHANLQHCSDLGRIAFGDTQAHMGALEDIAGYMVGPTGTIATIIDLLNDPEEARYALRPEMDALKDSTERCQKEAETIQKQFDEWYHFVMSLHKALIDKQGEGKEQRGRVGADRVEAEKKQNQLKQEIAAAQKEIKVANKAVKEAEMRRDKTDAYYKEVLSRPHPPQPSTDEILRKIKRYRSDEEEWPGVWPTIQKFILGKSDYEKEQMGEEVKRISDIFRRETEQYDKEEKYAKAALDEAHDSAEKMWRELEKAQKKTADGDEKLFKASTAMEDAKKNLEILGQGEIELSRIEEILANSCAELIKLKKHIEDLKDFFNSIHRLVNHTSNEHVKNFLSAIEVGIEAGGNAKDAKVIEKIRFRDACRQKLLNNVFAIQANFSATTDISHLYVQISRDYIRPGINRMESLPSPNHANYQAERRKFDNWCEDAARSIGKIAQEQNGQISSHLMANVQNLVRKTITAA